MLPLLPTTRRPFGYLQQEGISHAHRGRGCRRHGRLLRWAIGSSRARRHLHCPGANLQALRARGLTVESRLAGTFTLPVEASDNPSDVGPVDLVLFCVKTYDIDAAAENIRPLIHPDAMLLPLQNGI